VPVSWRCHVAIAQQTGWPSPNASLTQAFVKTKLMPAKLPPRTAQATPSSHFTRSSPVRSISLSSLRSAYVSATWPARLIVWMNDGFRGGGDDCVGESEARDERMAFRRCALNHAPNENPTRMKNHASHGPRAHIDESLRGQLELCELPTDRSRLSELSRP
jgi:hypothetical protein